MSRFEALLVKAALVHLVLTGALGVAFYLAPQLVPYLRVTHVHLGVVGFFLSMVMGVAYWMMPRPGRLQQERLEALTFFLLHGGLGLRVVAEPWWRYAGGDVLYGVTIASGVAVFAAIVTFAYAMQARVKTKDEIIALREAREGPRPPTSRGR